MLIRRVTNTSFAFFYLFYVKAFFTLYLYVLTSNNIHVFFFKFNDQIGKILTSKQIHF